MSPQLHLEARHAEVAELAVVEDEVCGDELGDLGGHMVTHVTVMAR